MAVHVGDIGVQIELVVKEDGQDLNLSTATNREIRLRDPNGTTQIYPATLVGTNRLRYATEAGDLDRSGPWQVRAHFTLDAWTGHTSAFQLLVEPV